MSDPQKRPTYAGQGYPEDAPPGSGIDPRDHPEDELLDDDDTHTRPGADGDPGQATGNPRAAGGRPRDED